MVKPPNLQGKVTLQKIVGPSLVKDHPFEGGLTPQELRLARLLLYGESHKDIGERLKISTGTVRAHAQNIYFKLDLEGRHQLTAVWIEWLRSRKILTEKDLPLLDNI